MINILLTIIDYSKGNNELILRSRCTLNQPTTDVAILIIFHGVETTLSAISRWTWTCFGHCRWNCSGFAGLFVNNFISQSYSSQLCVVCVHEWSLAAYMSMSRRTLIWRSLWSNPIHRNVFTRTVICSYIRSTGSGRVLDCDGAVSGHTALQPRYHLQPIGDLRIWDRSRQCLDTGRRIGATSDK